MLKYKTIEVDYKSTLKTFELAKCVFDGLLNVKIRGTWWWSFGLTYELARLIGLSMMLYFYDKPDLVHEVMAILRDGNIANIEDFLEKERFIRPNNTDSHVRVWRDRGYW
ncbi:MAG: hypothetical protein U5N58_05105 [Actinomycetota bacterium]|nr:hypothetical protein [Actinomycetota bacterium]